MTIIRTNISGCACVMRPDSIDCYRVRSTVLAPNLMKEASRRILLLTSLLLCVVLTAVLATMTYMASALRLVFVPYQFFLMGICVGALILATISLIAERNEWTHYRLYFFTVMTSAFILVVINSVVFRVLGGEQFIRRIMRIFWIVLGSR